MSNETTDTATVQAGEGAATDQAAIDAAAATAAEEESAGDERSEEQKAADVAAKAEAAEKARKARTQEKIDRTVKLAKTEAAKERDARHKIEIEKARLEGELEAIKRQGGKAGDRPSSTGDQFDAEYDRQNPKPTIDDERFSDQAEYLEALTDWKIEKREARKEYSVKKAQADEAHRGQKEAEVEMIETLQSQKDRGIDKYDDFEEVAGPANFSTDAWRALAASEIGEDIVYHLMSNPAERKKFDALSPALQAKEVGRIETGIESGKIVVTKKPVRRVSTAPEPAPRPLGSARPAPKTIAEAKTSEERFSIWERENKK